LKSKKIVIVRHGETDYNKTKRVQGSGIDAPLNELGWQQAEAFWHAYKDVAFDKVYTSNLQRTTQSVQRFIDQGIDHEVIEGLREICWGIKEGLHFSPESHSQYADMLEAWQKGDLTKKVEGGETPTDVLYRLKPAMEYIISRENEDLILICMHGRAMRILLCWALSYPLKYMDIFKHTNMGVYKLTYTGSMYSLDTWNDTFHLKGLSAI